MNFVHSAENNSESQHHLIENKVHFNKQCQRVFDMLMDGLELNVYDAMVVHGISSLPRRILDLKQRNVSISDKWYNGEFKRIKSKVWFMSETDKLNNKKFML